MTNEAVAGFMALKTLQEKPLRYFDGNYNEFRDKNMIIYIQKKYADHKSIITLQSERINVTQLPLKTFASCQLQIKPKAQDGLKEVHGTYELDDKVIEIMQKIVDKEQLVHEQQPQQTQKPKNWKKKPVSVPQKLALLMNENIEQADLEVLYNQYQRQNLKSSLNEFKATIKTPRDIYKKIGNKKIFQQLEFDDQEQVNFFMKKMCEDKKINACSVLELFELDEIKFKEDAWDEMERWRNIVQKRQTQEQLQAIMHDEEIKQNKQLVQIFKETRIDQFDPDFFKKKVKSKTMKRVNEAQDSRYHQFFVSTDTNKAVMGKEDFTRKRFEYSSPKARMDSTCRTTRPTTSVSRPQRVLHNSNIEFNKFIKQCDAVENTFQQGNNKINERIMQLDRLMDKASQYLEPEKLQSEKEPNKDFEKFKKQRLFKKKFVTYLIDKVEKQSDLLSKKIITVQSKKLIEKVLQEDL